MPSARRPSSRSRTAVVAAATAATCNSLSALRATSAFIASNASLSLLFCRRGLELGLSHTRSNRILHPTPPRFRLLHYPSNLSHLTHNIRTTRLLLPLLCRRPAALLLQTQLRHCLHRSNLLHLETSRIAYAERCCRSAHARNTFAAEAMGSLPVMR